MLDVAKSRKRHLFRATKVRRRLFFSSDEGNSNQTVDTTSSSSSSGVSGSLDGEEEEQLEDFFLEEAFDSVNIGDLNKTPVTVDQPSAVKEPPTKRRCKEKVEVREWRTREGKLLYKILSSSETSDVIKLDELKNALKTARDPRLLSRVSEVYDRMKLKMAGKLVNLYKKIERDIENLDKTMSPRSLLLEMRKKDAIKAILGVWGLDTRQHTDEMKTPPRIRPKVPLQELQVLPDGSLLRPNDSGYHETSVRTNNRSVRTCVEGCSCSSRDNDLDQPLNSTTRDDSQPTRQGNRSKILNVTQQEEEEKQDREVGVARKTSGSSDGSYCDCNFCLQNGCVDVPPQQPALPDPLQRFRDIQEVPTSSCQDMTDEQTERQTTRLSRVEEESYSSQVSRFRDTHQETWLNSDDSVASSMMSFNCQDDIIASSPLSYDVTKEGDEVATHHDDTAQMLGSLMLLPAETPRTLGRPVQGLTDSLMVVGSNSHVSRLSDSEDET
ncbi:hypothetical protein ACHWQZ_G003581 [Mnemiopsis leidyi]